ncbi:hypothetical protein ACWGQ5_55185 [Streptomyces sp. NPDC055722]
MPNTELAARVLRWITAHPEQHAQREWMHGVDHLLAQQPLPVGVTLCAASHTARLSGHALHRQGTRRGPVFAAKPGRDPVFVKDAARRELGLSKEDADALFDPMLPSEHVRAALAQLAAGS